MKILVCMKQVPAGTKVDIDPETGAMKRMSGATRTNPYDLFALETALRIREQQGGTVTVLTMGPPQAEEMMRDAYTMGADDAVILSDRKFAGADVLATSYALSQAIQVLGGADLILCGRQTTDGDTAQVGPAIAEHLHMPHAAWRRHSAALKASSALWWRSAIATCAACPLKMLPASLSTSIPKATSCARQKRSASASATSKRRTPRTATSSRAGRSTPALPCNARRAPWQRYVPATPCV